MLVPVPSTLAGGLGACTRLAPSFFACLLPSALHRRPDLLLRIHHVPIHLL